MLHELEKAIGHSFRDISLLENALAHSSYANQRSSTSLFAFFLVLTNHLKGSISLLFISPSEFQNKAPPGLLTGRNV